MIGLNKDSQVLQGWIGFSAIVGPAVGHPVFSSSPDARIPPLIFNIYYLLFITY